MRRPRPTALVLAALCAPACFYDSMGAGAGGAGSTTAGTSTAATTADSEHDPSTTGSPTPDTTTTTATSETTAAETTTTATTAATTGDPGDDCGAAHVQLLELVADAEIQFPMVSKSSQTGEGEIATSAIVELGTVDFTVELDCTAAYTIWARVFDAIPGSQFNDPDAFYAHVDDAEEVPWIYGCDTPGLDPGWSWQRIRSTQTCDAANDWTPKLAAGTHHIVLRNREGAAQDNQAAVARILVTNDPDYVPTSD